MMWSVSSAADLQVLKLFQYSYDREKDDVMPRVDFFDERCKGCGICVETCPKNCLVISKRFNRQGYAVAECETPELCNGCALCAEMCPDVVIEVWK